MNLLEVALVILKMPDDVKLLGMNSWAIAVLQVAMMEMLDATD